MVMYRPTPENLSLIYGGTGEKGQPNFVQSFRTLNRSNLYERHLRDGSECMHVYFQRLKDADCADRSGLF